MLRHDTTTHLFFYITLLALAISLAPHITAQWLSPQQPLLQAGEYRSGRCVPSSALATSNTELALIRPVCTPYLSYSSPYVWVDDDWAAQTTTGTTDSCYIQSLWATDDTIRQVANLFTTTQPSGNCQRFVLTTMCLFLHPRCDPTQDGPLYRTEEQNKLCPWMCEVLTNGTDVCSIEDNRYLADLGFDLFDPAVLPVLDCTRSEWATPAAAAAGSSDDGTPRCLSPGRIAAAPTHPRCEVYTGEFCRSVLGEERKIFLEAGQTQAELEARLVEQVSHTFLSIPYNGPCAQAQVWYFCNAVFRECLEVALQEQLEDNVGGTGWHDIPGNRTFPLALSPPTAACESYLAACTTVNDFYRYLSHHLEEAGAEGANTWAKWSPTCSEPRVGATHDCLKPRVLTHDPPALGFLEKSQTTQITYHLWGYGQAPRRLISRSFARTQDPPNVAVPALGTCPRPLVTPSGLRDTAILNQYDLPQRYALFNGMLLLIF